MTVVVAMILGQILTSRRTSAPRVSPHVAESTAAPNPAPVVIPNRPVTIPVYNQRSREITVIRREITPPQAMPIRIISSLPTPPSQPIQINDRFVQREIPQPRSWQVGKGGAQVNERFSQLGSPRPMSGDSPLGYVPPGWRRVGGMLAWSQQIPGDASDLPPAGIYGPKGYRPLPPHGVRFNGSTYVSTMEGDIPYP